MKAKKEVKMVSLSRRQYPEELRMLQAMAEAQHRTAANCLAYLIRMAYERKGRARG